MSIYFLRHASLVKIGFSDDVGSRVAGIRSAMPVPIEFVGYMPGGREVEAHFHEMLHRHRESGEWFQPTTELETFMAAFLIKEMPKRERDSRTPVHRASRIEWAAYSDILRAEAEKRWPDANHTTRIKRIVELFGWGHRRVRSLYDKDGYGRLLYEEVQTVDEFARGMGVPGMVRGGEGK